jgi:hypothetical protein
MGRFAYAARSVLRASRSRAGAARRRLEKRVADYIDKRGVAPRYSYVTDAPSPSTALDIFAGEWTSRFPPPLDDADAGTVPLFADVTLDWAIRELGGVAEQSVLECGPLEGMHTYMLLQRHAREVLAIEANRQAFLRCLVVKELLELDRAKFLCGDVVRFLDETPDHFDLCVASGVLYHMRNPAELVYLTSKVADRLYLWTHYWDGAVAESTRHAGLFTSHTPHEYRGFHHTLHRHEYGPARTSAFVGGSGSAGNWLSRDDLLGCLEHFGWRVAAVGFEDRAHQNGPSLALVAGRADVGSERP